MARTQGVFQHSASSSCGQHWSTAEYAGMGLPDDGVLVSLQANPEHAVVAKSNIARAGLGAQGRHRVDEALQLLRLLANQAGPFDFICIDAQKPNNPRYLEWSLRLARCGAVTIGDNVVRDGAVVDATRCDPSVIGVRDAILTKVRE